MQTTYRKQTAAAILKTARVEVMQAGNAEIVVDLPGYKPSDKTSIIALLGTRQSPWGGTYRDVLVLTDVDGLNVRLSTTQRSLARLEVLHDECERIQRAENAKAGY